MFSRRCQEQNDRTNQEKISCFGQNLDFTLYFTIKTSIFKLWPLFRFLCLINSFYRRYVFCINNISNISNILSQLALCGRYLVLFRRYLALFGVISALFRRYLALFRRYLALFRRYWALFRLFRQNLVPQKGPHGIHLTFFRPCVHL